MAPGACGPEDRSSVPQATPGRCPDLVMRVVDMFYLIGPSNRISGAQPGAFVVSWLDFVGIIAVGGIWLWWFFGELMKRTLVPAMDPYFEGVIEHGRGH